MLNEHHKVAKLSNGYPKILRDLFQRGDVVDTRLGRAKEFIDYSLAILSPQCCIVRRDGMSKEFMELEIAMLLAGTFDRKFVEAVVPRAAELITVATAYGPRTTDQLMAVERELTESPDSRRAIVYVGRQSDLASMFDPQKSKARAGEVPCTMTWQFLLRDGQLHMIVNMRSQDAVWGMSYDAPCFVAVQMALAKALRVHVGRHYHHVGSFHVYERHWELKALENNHDGELEIELGQTMEQTRLLARAELERIRKRVKA